ncbi:hypothetical protein [Jiulongibacter sediminis]|uniref:hypothetical protein n=1 Tax=Jiulongibacter sediminis TaxID=1605367 RepID=UPI0026EDB7D8|nr:hypothetical protein [Jiulongibacter sediminis]
MKKYIYLLTILILSFSNLFSQSYNSEKIALTNFITRMYNSQPWSGVRVFLDYENKYLISLVELNPANYKSENEIVRVAEIKSRSQVNQFLNGSYITSETIVPTTDSVSKKNPSSVEDVKEVIKETSIGYVSSMELISTFISEPDSNRKVFIYLKLLEKLKKDVK